IAIRRGWARPLRAEASISRTPFGVISSLMMQRYTCKERFARVSLRLCRRGLCLGDEGSALQVRGRTWDAGVMSAHFVVPPYLLDTIAERATQRFPRAAAAARNCRCPTTAAGTCAVPACATPLAPISAR